MEMYGSSKHVLDLANVAYHQSRAPLTRVPPHTAPRASTCTIASQSEWEARRAGWARSIVICPGAVDTEITPAFFKPLLPLFTAVRGLLPGFNITVQRGIFALLAAATAPSEAVPRDAKFVGWAGQLVPASLHAGWFPSTIDGPRGLAMVRDWAHEWLAAAVDAVEARATTGGGADDAEARARDAALRDAVGAFHAVRSGTASASALEVSFAQRVALWMWARRVVTVQGG